MKSIEVMAFFCNALTSITFLQYVDKKLCLLAEDIMDNWMEGFGDINDFRMCRI